jgi:hypothetical protein
MDFSEKFATVGVTANEIEEQLLAIAKPAPVEFATVVLPASLLKALDAPSDDDVHNASSSDSSSSEDDVDLASTSDVCLDCFKDPCVC